MPLLEKCKNPVITVKHDGGSNILFVCFNSSGTGLRRIINEGGGLHLHSSSSNQLHGLYLHPIGNS